MKAYFLSGAMLLAFALPDLASAQMGQPLKIGEINSYSTESTIANPYHQGSLLALEEINAAGGVNGRLLEILPRDDHGKPDEAVRQAQQLLAVDKVDVLSGTSLPAVALALTGFAGRSKTVFIAGEPLTDVITLEKGNRYTFRIRPSTLMQTAMLADVAATLPAKRWAILAPNYELGQSAVLRFKRLLKAKRPDVEFVVEQWPALGKINAANVVNVLAKGKPEAIFNLISGADLGKFIQEANQRGLLANTTVLSMLTGEPEALAILGASAPKGWIVTGYPGHKIETPAHRQFVEAYSKKFGCQPTMASLIGYSAVTAIAEGFKKAQSTDPEQLIKALRNLSFHTPLGPVLLRGLDQQSSMGSFVGTVEVKDGVAGMRDWRYMDGKNYLLDEVSVKARRPSAAMK